MIKNYNDFCNELLLAGFSLAGGNNEGRQQKLSQSGKGYGWFFTVFCVTEKFFSDGVFKEENAISTDEAVGKITERVYALNPQAEGKKVKKFIAG